MLSEVFYWILNMSIIGSVFGILIYLLRFVKGFPKFACYALWVIVLVRFLCPFGINSRFSLLSLLNKASQKVFVRMVPIDAGSQQLSISNAIQGASSYEPFTLKTNLLDSFFRIGSVIWIIIAAAAVLAMFIMYFMTKAEIKQAECLRDNIYTSPMVSTPTVYGIIKPKIILPVCTENEQLEYILAHEKVHIRRRDNVWRMLAIITACLHWFNPFIWWFLKSFLSDMELACDSAAVKGMEEGERKSYARTLLLYTMQEKKVFASAFGSSRIRIRIENVLTYRRLTLFSLTGFAVMGIAIAFLLLTNAQ